MTMPVLLSNYKKVQTVSRLKKAYSTLSQAFTRAQADYGDPNIWDNLKLDESDNIGNQLVAENCEKYLLPYLGNVVFAKLSTLTERGFSKYYGPDGKTNTNLAHSDVKYYIIEMADSTTYFFDRESMGDLIIYMDIDGIKKNNIWGKDAFMFRLNRGTGKFEPYYLKTQTREQNLDRCSKNGKSCVDVIIYDGWTIKKDYPVKF